MDSVTRTTTAAFPGCTNFLNVKYKARANNSAGWGGWSEFSFPNNFICKAVDAPDAPFDVTVSDEGPRHFKISWKLPLSTRNLNGTAVIGTYRVLLECEQEDARLCA